MLKKITDNLGFAGLMLLLVGLIHYSVNDVWVPMNRWLSIGGAVLIGVYLIVKLPTIFSALGTRGGRQGSAAGVILLLVLGILVLVNFLNFRHHRRWDLSEGSLNSLSEQSLQVSKSLQDDVRVIGFFEQKGPAVEFENLMKEYRFASPKIEFEVVDPRKDPSRISEYQIESDGQIVVTSGQKKQKVSSADEEKITNAIIKVTRDQEKVIYFLTGHGEHAISGNDENGYLAIRGAIERQNYVAKDYDLATEGKLPEDVSLLVAAGPKSNFLPNEVAILDQYLQAGGKLLLLVDPQTKFSMNDWLAQYGVGLDDDVVVDNSGLGRLVGLGPAVPLVNAYNNHPVVAKMDTTTFFPFARSVKTVSSSLGYKSENLFSSSARSWGETELGAAGETVGFDQGKDLEGPLPLAVVSSKKIDAKPAAAASEGEGGTSGEGDAQAKPESRIILVGDSDFVENKFIEVGGGQSDLFLNMVSWLLKDEDLIAVRPKDPTDRKINMTERDRSVLFWIAVILLPLSTLVFGVTIWWRRR